MLTGRTAGVECLSAARLLACMLAACLRCSSSALISFMPSSSSTSCTGGSREGGIVGQAAHQYSTERLHGWAQELAGTGGMMGAGGPCCNLAGACLRDDKVQQAGLAVGALHICQLQQSVQLEAGRRAALGALQQTQRRRMCSHVKGQRGIMSRQARQGCWHLCCVAPGHDIDRLK